MSSFADDIYLSHVVVAGGFQMYRTRIYVKPDRNYTRFACILTSEISQPYRILMNSLLVFQNGVCL